jgi:hypothetical protein
VLQNGFAVVLLWSNKDARLDASIGGVTTAVTAIGETTLSISPATQEALPGTTVTYTVANAATSVDTLELSLSDLPVTLVATLAETFLAPGASTTLTIAVAADAGVGTTTAFTVTGTGVIAATTESATGSLAVVATLTPPPVAEPPAPAVADFSVTVTPTTQEMTRGGNLATFVITTQPAGTGSANTTLKLTAQHVRRGLKVDLSRKRVAAGETVILVVRAHRDARRKPYEFVLKASSDQADQRVTLTVVVK